MTVAWYEARFTKLSCFTPQLIVVEENKALKFQDGMKPYLKNKISILKWSVYLKVVDRALIAEKDAKELYQYREQQRKMGSSDSAYGSHVQKKLASSRNQSRGKAAQNSNIVFLLMVKCMGTSHVIERHEFALVVGS